MHMSRSFSKKILFVCEGNVGRSQICEALYNAQTGTKLASSAGTRVFENEGQRIDENAFAEPVIRFMKREGIDVSQKTRKQITPEMLEDSDRIIVMVKPEAAPDFIKQCSNIEFVEIDDPSGASDETYMRIIDDIKALVHRIFTESK